jgi:hypothetical protein
MNQISQTINYRKISVLSIGTCAAILGLLFYPTVSPAYAVTSSATKTASAPAQPAYALEPLPDLVNYHDFVVGPGKIELQIAPGQSQTVDLTIANRLGSDKVFQIGEEDFTGSNDPSRSVVLLGSDRGPYSLKDSIHIPSTKILIPFGQRARVPITVSLPADAQPGGLYGSVVVSVVSVEGSTTSSGVGGTNPIITRIGTLFFVRVPGPTEASGSMQSFTLPGGSFVWSSSISQTDPILFNVLFKNDGNVYLDPNGTISVTNMFGATVGNIIVDPWFAMPDSLRFREIKWQPTFLFGRYVAHAAINPGYGSTTETADLVFWVIPWKILLVIFIGLVIVIGGIRWIASRISFVPKKSK